MPTVVVKTGGTHPFGAAGEAGAFLDLFLEKAGFVKECRWEARLEKTGRCSWDSPPARVVGYEQSVVYLRVKPSLNAAVDHFARLLIPVGCGYAAGTIYIQLKALVQSFHRFVRIKKLRKRGLPPTRTIEGAAPGTTPGDLLIRFQEQSQALAGAERRLEANRRKYRDLQAEMKRLDDEYHEITHLLLTNREASTHLSRLLERQGVTQIKI